MFCLVKPVKTLDVLWTQHLTNGNEWKETLCFFDSASVFCISSAQIWRATTTLSRPKLYSWIITSTQCICLLSYTKSCSWPTACRDLNWESTFHKHIGSSVQSCSNRHRWSQISVATRRCELINYHRTRWDRQVSIVHLRGVKFKRVCCQTTLKSP